ncbi:MAG: NAD-binding protein, partial [Bacteroidota bacterium]
ANINVEQILLINQEAIILFCVVVFVLRPVGVFLSTTATSLSFREKLFISWVGPRGIVAAGIASLFGIKLSGMDVPGAEMLTPLVFLIVLGTVLLNATTARPIARWLGVTLDSSDGFLIIGANNAARVIAQYIQQQNYHVVLVDRSQSAIEKAQELGLEAIEGDIFSEDFSERYELLDVGYLLALTSNDRVNEVACQRFEATFGENGTYRLIGNEELDKPSDSLDDMVLFDNTDDFIRISEAIRDYPELNHVELESKEQFEDILKQLRIIHKSIPLMILRKTGKIDMIVANKENHNIEKGDKLVYVGEALTVKATETAAEVQAD